MYFAPLNLKTKP